MWDKTVISGLRCYASDWHGLLITVGGVDWVSGDFGQNAIIYTRVNAHSTHQLWHCAIQSPNTVVLFGRDPVMSVL